MSSFWPIRTVFDGMLLLVEGTLSGGFSVKRCSPPSGSMLVVLQQWQRRYLIKGFLRNPFQYHLHLFSRVHELRYFG